MERHPIRTLAARRRQEGVTLLVTLLMMVMLGTLGMAALEAVTSDRRVGGFLSRAQLALFAAEAGLERTLRNLSDADLPSGAAALETVAIAVPAGTAGDSSIHPHGAPTYQVDDNAVQGVSYLGAGSACEEWVMSIEVGGPMYLYSLWDVRVKGETPDGAVSRVQASATRCYAYGS